MKRIIGIIEKRASWKSFVILLVGSALLATAIISMLFGSLEVNPNASMDSETYYTSEIFFNYLELQGDTGRASYLYLHLIDYLFIVFFYSFLAITLALLLKQAGSLNKRLRKYIIIIPLIASICDLFENLCIDISIIFYPKRLYILATLSGYFTATKMAMIYLTFIMIILLSIYTFVMVLKSNRKSK